MVPSAHLRYAVRRVDRRRLATTRPWSNGPGSGRKRACVSTSVGQRLWGRRSSSAAIFVGQALDSTGAVNAQAGGSVFELRTYTANEGRMEGLLDEFRSYAARIFERHGMKNVGYWVPTDAPRSEDTLIYILQHDSREAAQQSWSAFIEDPEWQAGLRGAQRRRPPRRLRRVGLPAGHRLLAHAVGLGIRSAAAAGRGTIDFPGQPGGRSQGNAGVAQLVEQLIRNQQVSGSSPLAGSNIINNLRGSRLNAPARVSP